MPRKDHLVTFSGLTNQQRISPQSSSRQGAKIDMVILHHSAATDANMVVNMMVNKTRTVSANYVIANTGTIIGVVPEELRAWTSGSATDGGKGAAFDRRAITFECADLSVNGWTISDATYESLAKLLADFHNRYGIPLDADHVVGHSTLWTRWRASYATACPGGMDVAKVINMARAKIGQGSVGTVGVVASSSNGDPIVESGNQSTHSTKEIQAVVGAGQDGLWGPETAGKVKSWQAAHGLTADGIVGPATAAAMFGTSTSIAVDGDWGTATTRRLQQVLGVPVDGQLGPVTYKALQSRIGTPADGQWGPNSKRALQRHLGVIADGIVGPATVSALQTRLNQGTV